LNIKIIRLIIGSIFILTGILKLISLNYFSMALLQYNLNFDNASLIAKLIILIEILIGLLLITGVWRRTVTLIAFCISLIFLILALKDIFAGDITPCGCFGGIELLENSLFFRLFLIITLSFMSIIVFFKDKSSSLPWSKTRWLYLVVGLLALSIFLIRENNFFTNAINNNQITINNTPNTVLKKLQDTLLRSDLIDLNHNVLSLNELLNEYQFSILLLINSSDCRACFSSVTEIEKELNKATNSKNQILIVVQNYTLDEIKTFSREINLKYPLFLFEQNIKVDYIRTPSLFVIRKGGDIFYGCELKPGYNIFNVNKIASSKKFVG